MVLPSSGRIPGIPPRRPEQVDTLLDPLASAGPGELIVGGPGGPQAQSKASVVQSVLDTVVLVSAYDSLADAVAALVDAGGGTLIGDGGTHTITAPLVLPSHSAVLGNGMTIQRTGANSGVFRVVGVTDVHISDVTMRGDYESGGIAGSSAIHVEDAERIVATRCDFASLHGSAVGISNGRKIWVTDNVADTLAGSFVRMNETSGEDINAYIYIRDNVLTSCQMSDMYGNAAIQAHGGGNVHHHVWIAGNRIDGAWVGVGLDLVSDAVVADNAIRNCQGEAVAMSGSRIRVTGNDVTLCGAAGILVWAHIDVDDIRIAENRASACPQGVALVPAANNVTMSRVFIVHNILSGNERGVQAYLSGSPSGYRYHNVLVAWNDLTGNTVAPYNLAPGTSGTYIALCDNLTRSPGDEGVTLDSGWSGRSPVNYLAGEEDTDSVEDVVVIAHRNGGAVASGTELRLLGTFAPNLPTTKAGGVGFRKELAFANQVDTYLYAWSGGELREGLCVSVNTSEGDTALWLMTNDGSSIRLQKVEIGDVDSGGAGYRMLRVVN